MTAPAEAPAPAGDEVRLARVALGWLAESGSWALWSRVEAHGPVRVLDGLLTQGVQPLPEPGPALAGPAVAGSAVAGSALAGPALAGSGGGGRADLRERAAAALVLARRLDARVVIPEDDEWPAQLAELAAICGGPEPIDRDAAPPLCLWVRGPVRLNEALARSVSVVGSRAATGYGAHLAREIGYGLAGAGWTVVSGGAYGVDAHAHRGALAAGGPTVAVLATGIDRAYPAGHANLFDRIAEDGLLISEWPLNTDPFRRRFLIRNRLIAAMSCGTVLVEAAARSGARQTFRRARQLRRARMVVPGPVTSAMSVGCHEELRGDLESRLVTGVPHLLEEVGRLGTDLAPLARGPEHPRDLLDPVESRLVEALLKRKPLASEALAARARVRFSEATRVLPSLVVRGFARRQGDGYVLAAPGEPP